MRLFRILSPIILGIALASCGSGEKETDIAAGEGIFLRGNGAEPQTLDPHLATGNPEANILEELLEGLTVFDATKPELVSPGVAESWEHNADYTRWTFHLRDNARFTNGDAITAQDFLYAWERFLNPKLGAQDSSYLYSIANAEEYNLGQIDDFSRVGVKAPDARTLTVELVSPDPYFQLTVANARAAPLSRRAIEAHGASTDRQNPWAKLGNFVGNGPFMMTDWKTNQILEVRKNPDYWNAGAIRLNGAKFYPVENANTEEALFLNGRLHVTMLMAPDRVPIYQQKKSPEFVSETALRPQMYIVNVERKPLDDVRVRQALSLAIDRKALVERVSQGGEVPAGGLMPDGYPDYPAFQVLDHDLEKARALLAEAGYPQGKGFPRFEIMINTSDSHRKVAQAIQEMWRKDLGIDVGIFNQEWRVYLDSLLKGDFAVARAGLVLGSPDVLSPLKEFRSDGARNMGNWNNPKYDALIRQASLEGDMARRNALLHDAEQVLLNDLPVIPLYWGRNNFLLDPGVKGWTANPYGTHPLRYVTFD